MPKQLEKYYKSDEEIRQIFIDVLKENKFEIPDFITMNKIKFEVERRINYIYNVHTQFIENFDDMYVLQYGNNKIYVKNSELVRN